jgi:hypothetical protein
MEAHTMISVTTDQMSAAAAYIAREWGGYGYRIELIESPTRAVSVFHVVASDGGRFIIAADTWGNTRGPVDSHGYDTPERAAALTALVTEMHANAVAA